MWATSEPQTLDEIRDWHREIVYALLNRRGSIQHAIRQNSTVPSRFVGMTEGEIDACYDADRRELDRLTVLNLVASTEGAIRIDYFRRISKKLKDPLSQAYRKWHKRLTKKKQSRPDFDERGILEVIKTARSKNDTPLIDKRIVGQYRECLPARHWMGHGRYWNKPRAVDQLDPDEVYDRANKILQAIAN